MTPYTSKILPMSTPQFSFNSALEEMISDHPDTDDFEAVGCVLDKLQYKVDSATGFEIDEAISMEEVTTYSVKGTQFIVNDAAAVSEWLVKSLDHIDERIDDYLDKAGELEKALRATRTLKAPGTYNYRSISRNLSTGNTVVPDKVAVGLDGFMTKIHSILHAGNAGEFEKLLGLIESFDISGDVNAKLEEVYKASRAYYKSILPVHQKTDIYDLEIPKGRELWMDKTIYIGGKVFYSMTPTELTNSPGNLWSGFVRVTKADLDLKAEFPYLSRSQSLEVLKVLQRHARTLIRVKAYQRTARRLLKAVQSLNTKYNQARKQRNRSLKPYILMMNLAVSHLYGIQIKAINQAEGVYKAALKYVEKSQKALQEKVSVS